MTIQELINQEDFHWPFYGPGYTNHLPMALRALDALGANITLIQKFEVDYKKRHTLTIVHSPEPIVDYDVNLGKREQYEAFVHFYQKKIDNEGIDCVVKETLNYLILGIGSVLFHGLIRIHYAILGQNQIEISRALATLACSFEPLIFSGKPIKIEDFQLELSRYIKDRDGLFYLSEESPTKEKAILEGLVQLYLSTSSFIVLHTITGFEALVGLKGYFDDYNHALNIFTISVLRTLLRLSMDDYKTNDVSMIMSWDEIIHKTIEVKDEHTIKFVYSCYQLKKIGSEEELKKASLIKLYMNHQTETTTAESSLR